MVAALADRAGEVLMELSTQGLANVAWGLTVAGCYPPQLIRRWRALAGAEQHFFKPAELNQLHWVEVALRLEAPPGAAGLGPLPAETASFFHSLYQAGRLRAFAGRAWARHQDTGPRSVSAFQMQVYKAMCALGVACQLEYSEAGEYSIDVAIPEQRIAVEADGPVHFAVNTNHLMGGTALKRRLLQRLGWQAVSVPQHEWRQLSPSQRQQYMLRKLEEAGLRLPGSQAELAQAQAQVQEQAGAGAPAPALSTGQQQRQGLPGAEVRQQEVQDRREEQEEQQEQGVESPGKLASVSSGNGCATEAEPSLTASGPAATSAGPAATSAVPAATSAVGASESREPSPSTRAQRAQRLALLHFRQGKLSRGGLVKRTGLQAGSSGRTSSDRAGGGGVNGGDTGSSKAAAPP